MKKVGLGNIVTVLLLAASAGRGADKAPPLQNPKLSAEPPSTSRL